MLINVPSAEDLDGMALRLYFDAWGRSVSLISDFAEYFALDDTNLEEGHDFKEEWGDYVVQAQSEIGTICATIQQSAELRLKAIICATSPYLLLLNGAVPFKAGQQHDIDFTEQRTLDAVDLPNAVRTLTEFGLPDSYVQQYGNMRSLRNQVTHLGSHKGGLSPYQIIKILGQQYTSLWQDGRWLYRRVQFDGNSARRFFHDDRYSSAESNVMLELPYTMNLLDNAIFKKAFGVTKGKLVGFCPYCMSARARKSDADGHTTAYRTGASTATCAMCERDLTLQTVSKGCRRCGHKTDVSLEDEQDADIYGPMCFDCGDDA